MVGFRGLEACADMPIMDRGAGVGVVKHQVNGAALAKLLQEWTSGRDNVEFLVVVERQVPFARPGKGPGASSIFSLGHTAGTIEGVAMARRLSYREVSPHTWKKAFKISGGKKGKDIARALAQRLYPEADLARVKDHNRAESILIARWGYQEHA